MSLSAFSLPEADIPPWNWNPAATFQASFIAAREEERAQQEFQLGMELEKILLPAKLAKAEYDTKKFQMDAQVLERIYRNQTAALDQSYSGIKSAIGGSGSNVAGNMGSDPNTPSVGRWSAARYVGQPTQTSTPVAKPKTKPTWSVVQPAATSPGP